jgi:phenylalanyl-tRNA synthetase alpha chain
MNDLIPQLTGYDEPSLDAAFATLAGEVRAETASLADADAFHLRWLGRKQGRLKLVSEAWLKSAPAEARKPLGIRFNQLKQQIEEALAAAATTPKTSGRPSIDITLPGTARMSGSEHPLVKTMNEVVAVFHRLGYSTALGPQVESDFYNFEALNFPPNHPARDTQDTLVIARRQPAEASGARASVDAHTHFAGADPHHDRSGSAYSHRRTGQSASQRRRGRHAFAGLPPGGRAVRR